MLSLLALPSISLAVGIKITPDPTTVAPCPNTEINYYVQPTQGGSLPACSWNWTITNGVIVSTQGNNYITVKWTDNPGVTSTLTVRSTGCNDSRDNNSTASNTYQVMSVFGVSFGTQYASSVDIPVCQAGSTTFQISVQKMYVPNTGGIGQPPLKEVTYRWTVPSGYQSVPAADANSVLVTSVNNITLKATTAEAGTLTVQGSLKNTCGSSNYSNAKSITITRSPTIAVSPQGGFTGLTCGYSAAFNYAVTATTFATSYAWTVPPGLTADGSTTNSTIALKFASPPSNGSSYPLSVIETLNTGYSVTRSISIPYNNSVPTPGVASTITDYSMCDGETTLLSLILPPGYPTDFGFDWYANGTSITVQNPDDTQTAHPSTNPVHYPFLPWENKRYVTNLGNYGTQTMGVRMKDNSGVCPASNWAVITKHFGTWSNSEFTINGYSAVCPNTVADFTASISGTQGITGYQWTAPPGWSSSGGSTPSFSVSVPPSFSGGQAVLLRLQNRCGLTNTPSVMKLSVSGTCGFKFAATPNPTSNEVVISDLDATAETSVQVVDQSGNVRKKLSKKANKLIIDVSDLPDGIYFMMMTQRGVTETQQIVIKH